ncbi:MAG: GntP family permease [Xanthobacteraceae bacterium]
MSGTPLFDALLLLAAVVVLVVTTQLRRLHPFLVMVFVASAFGLAAGLSISLVGRAFGTGFSQALYSPGLVIVAAGLVSGLAESPGAAGQVATAISHWLWFGRATIAALLGLIAGIGALPAAAFAVLMPLLRPIGGGASQRHGAAPIALALAISASHGLVLFSPVPIAAASILEAAWGRVALFGLPLAVLLVVIGAAWARWLPVGGAALPSSIEERPPTMPKQAGWAAIVVILAMAIPLLMLIEQSIGTMPSEPLGGGPARELVIGVGRPLSLFVVGVGIVVIGLWRPSLQLLADPNWTSRALGNVAGILLTVGAAGGLQRLCQETGMAELIGERLLDWHLGGFGGLLIPFLVAAAIKTLQGSSLVAAIAAAGMVQPILPPLGLGGENAKALATLAIGAGAMTVTHINDEFFWLVSTSVGLRPLRGLVALTVGTLLQGLVAVAALLLLSMLVSG